MSSIKRTCGSTAMKPVRTEVRHLDYRADLSGSAIRELETFWGYKFKGMHGEYECWFPEFWLLNRYLRETS
jgi:hypothetical protein